MGGNCLLEDVGRRTPPSSPPPVPVLPPRPRSKNMQTQQCRGSCQLPPTPPTPLDKMFLHFPTDTFPVRPAGPRCPWRKTDRRKRSPVPPPPPPPPLQPQHSGQGIPKLEGANICCGALVLGPPQKGPVLSGNLVIFSASLTRLQL